MCPVMKLVTTNNHIPTNAISLLSWSLYPLICTYVLSYLFGFATEETSTSNDLPIDPVAVTDPTVYTLGGH